jgi:hypothetical protein
MAAVSAVSAVSAARMGKKKRTNNNSRGCAINGQSSGAKTVTVGAAADAVH